MRPPHAAHKHPALDFDRAPFLVIWETTRACDLACVHCRADALPDPHPDELTLEEGLRVVTQTARMGTPILIFSGGDPLKRKDLDILVRHAHDLGLKTGVIPAATPLVTRERIARLAAAGLDQIAFSLDAADAETHEAFRRVPGTYARTIEAARQARELGLNLQINSLVNIHNLEGFDALAEVVEGLGVVFWEIFFLVPTGRGSQLALLEPRRFRDAFEKIDAVARRVPFIVKVTEGQHYRRFVAEQGGVRRGPNPGAAGTAPGERVIGSSPQTVNAGKGFLFVSHLGEVYPSGFLPLSAGNVRRETLADIYRTSPLFRDLRNPELLKGRCGRCSYARLCGGSRARAWAMTGDYLAEDPGCFYEVA